MVHWKKLTYYKKASMEEMKNKKHRRNTENSQPFITVITLNVRALDWMFVLPKYVCWNPTL